MFYIFPSTDGEIRIHANGPDVWLHRSDYLNARAGTIHSFSFHAHNTHMLGILTTPLCEKFFEYMNVPSDFRCTRRRHRTVVPSGRIVARRKPNSTSPSWAHRHGANRRRPARLVSG